MNRLPVHYTMNDVFLHLVRSVLPPTYFILVETLACVCRAFARFPAEFRRANGISERERYVEEYLLPSNHAYGGNSDQRKVSSYGRTLFIMTDRAGSFAVDIMNAHISISFGVIDLGMRESRKTIIGITARHVNGTIITREYGSSRATLRSTQRFEIAKEVMSANNWAVDDATFSKVARAMIRAEM